jgi:hypothetical protein
MSHYAVCVNVSMATKNEARWQCHNRSPSLRESLPEGESGVTYPIIIDDGITGTRLSGVFISP